VRHPHYPNYNTLVKLPALDEGNTVDYNVALIICGIISDNSWSTGWFARSNDGSNVCEQGVPLAPMATSFTLSTSRPVNHSHSHNLLSMDTRR
jgi:hypothetical protein